MAVVVIGLALGDQPTGSLHPERGVRAPLPRQGSSPQGRNGAAGSGAADEPGPQGEAKPSFPGIHVNAPAELAAERKS